MLLLAVVLVVAAVTDVISGKVYNWLTYPAMVAGIIWSVILNWTGGGAQAALPGLGESLIAMIAGIVGFAIIFAAGGMGGGDVKLMGAVGAITASMQCVLATAFYAFIIAAIIAIIVMFKRKLVKQTITRLFNALLFFSARIKTELPTDSPRIPFALAICIGGLLAFAEIKLGLNTPWRPAW